MLSNPGGPTFERVPTDLELNGDFSQSRVYLPNGTKIPYAPLFNQFIRQADGTLTYRPRPGFTRAPSASNPQYQFNNFPLFDVNGTRLSVNGVSYVNPIAQRIARAFRVPRGNFQCLQSSDVYGRRRFDIHFRQRRAKHSDQRHHWCTDQQCAERLRESGCARPVGCDCGEPIEQRYAGASNSNLPGTNGQNGVCAATELIPTGGAIRTAALSPACVMTDLAPRFNNNLYRLQQYAVSARIWQLGLKLYF